MAQTPTDPDSDDPDRMIRGANGRGTARAFSYDEAFARNIGWVRADEQQVLRRKRVAIAGLGGVGGAHLMTLVRLGIGRLRIADFDRFDMANFNRQTGAAVSSLGQPKSQVLAAMARDVNPELELDIFPDGVGVAQVDRFLDGVDLYVDGLDFFAFEARGAVFAACARRAIPAITVAPLGMGAALLNFMPGRMSFERYFGWHGQPDSERALRFLVGLSPAFLHAGYLVDPAAVDFESQRGPSTGIACQLCAGIGGAEALKILLARGRVISAPRGVHFDAYRNVVRITWRPWGHANPIQRLALRIARKRYLGSGKPAGATESPAMPGSAARAGEDESLPADALLLRASAPLIEPWRTLLDAARWAPSGDNTQPWRFEVRSEHHLVVHGFDTRDWCLYDIDGRPSRVALGGMLETLRIAAAERGLVAQAAVRVGAFGGKGTATPAGAVAPPGRCLIDVRLVPGSPAREPVLFAAIRSRSVQRRRLSTDRLPPAARRAIEAAVAQAGSFRCIWLEGWADRWAIARLLSASTRIRLLLPQAHQAHARVIQWRARVSPDRIPDQAIGLDPLTLRLMSVVLPQRRLFLWAMRYLGGTWIPRLELDWLPALSCGAHLAIVRGPGTTAAGIEDDLQVGAAVQRAWLTAESLALRMQPEMSLPILAEYADRQADFLQAAGALPACRELGRGLEALVGASCASSLVWLCRVGAGPVAEARSVRLPLQAQR